MGYGLVVHMDHHLEELLIQSLAGLLVVATAVSYLFKWIKLPTVLGYILTGVLIGPHVLGVITDAGLISAMSQIGIIFLLFIIGLELPISKLKQMGFRVPIAGCIQLGLTTVALAGVFAWVGMPLQLAFILGAVLALSSTAIVLKNLEDSAALDSVHGRLILGILIIQDLFIIPLMALVPTFSSPMTADVVMSVGWIVLKSMIFLALCVLVSWRFFPFILDKLGSSHSRELFILSVVTIALGAAFITGLLGLSYEAGAFIAGLSLSGNIYTRQVLLDSRPFREVFTTLFFVSVGLLVDLEFLHQNVQMALLVTLGLVVVKFLAAYSTALLTRYPAKVALWVGFSLFQAGEFSFILLHRVLENASHNEAWKTMLDYWSPMLVTGIILSMFVTPLAIRAVPGISAHLFSRKKERHVLAGLGGEVSTQEELPPEQVVIAGYGPIARHLAASLKVQRVPFTIIDMNLVTIKKLKAEGVPCVFGDVSHPEILKAAGLRNAKLLALTFPDIRASELALKNAKKVNPDVICVARARYLPEIERLYSFGADRVVHEELEAAIRFITSTLHTLGQGSATIHQIINLIREQEAESGKSIPVGDEQPVFGRLSLLVDTKIEWIELPPESPLVGKRLAESDIRKNTGVNVLAIANNMTDQQEINPDSNYRLQPHDVLVVIGTVEQLQSLEEMLT